MPLIEPYKGVRDFYPEDQRIQNHIFAAMRTAVESFGYEEMNASILESTDLYRSKTSEEIVNEQTYTFLDRGERSVTLRPEMTPTVARMVAAKRRELGMPLRLYSIQNFFRYERPQRGRLREFWQLNADLFGVAGVEADIEAIEVAYRVMKQLGAKDDMFTVRVNSRKLLYDLYEPIVTGERTIEHVFSLLDRKGKMSREEFEKVWEKDFGHPFTEAETAHSPRLQAVFDALRAKGIPIVFDPHIVRGFTYYTDLVFEVYDTNPENARSLFGGGRYDKLISQYGGEDTPAVGFAMGDVPARDFLETHNLLPHLHSTAMLYLAPVAEKDAEHASRLADSLREKGVNVALGMKHTKIGDHVKAAVKLGVRYFIAYGEEEQKSGTVTLKELSTQKEEKISLDNLASRLLS